jgi:hypothetical protein
MSEVSQSIYDRTSLSRETSTRLVYGLKVLDEIGIDSDHFSLVGTASVFMRKPYFKGSEGYHGDIDFAVAETEEEKLKKVINYGFEEGAITEELPNGRRKVLEDSKV